MLVFFYNKCFFLLFAETTVSIIAVAGTTTAVHHDLLALEPATVILLRIWVLIGVKCCRFNSIFVIFKH